MRSKRVAGWVLAYAVFYFLFGVVTLVIGVHDASLARATLGVAVSSALLILVSVLFVVAGVQLVELSRRTRWEHGRRPRCKPPVLIALLATTLLGVYVLLSALKTASTQRPYVAAVALVMIGVSVAGFYLFGKEARVTLPRVGALALGLIGTTIGAWQFWYQNQYVPLHAGSRLTLAADLRRVSADGPFDIVRATVTYGNVGGNAVSELGSTYTLTGSHVIRCTTAATADAVRSFFKNPLVDPQRSRYMSDVREMQPADVLAAGKFVRDGKRLDSNVPGARTFVFFVPRERYQLLRFRAQMIAIPASIPLSQRTPPDFSHRLLKDNELYGFWHVGDDSWLHDLLSGRERWVLLRYELVNPQYPTHANASPDLRVTARFPTPTWAKRRPNDAQVKKLFAADQENDVSEPFADAELALATIPARRSC